MMERNMTINADRPVNSSFGENGRSGLFLYPWYQRYKRETTSYIFFVLHPLTK